VIADVGTRQEREERRGDGSRRGAEAQRMTENEIGTRVIEAAIAVHRELGPGLLETVYEVVLARELTERGLKVVRQAPAHKKQVQTYLKLTGCKLGHLLNFGEDVTRTGISRCVNGLEEQPLREKKPEFQQQVATSPGYRRRRAWASAAR
jgi:hypothetical protein